MEPNYCLDNLVLYVNRPARLDRRGVGKGEGSPSRARARSPVTKITLRNFSCKYRSEGEALLVKRLGEFGVSY